MNTKNPKDYFLLSTRTYQCHLRSPRSSSSATSTRESCCAAVPTHPSAVPRRCRRTVVDDPQGDGLLLRSGQRGQLEGDPAAQPVEPGELLDAGQVGVVGRRAPPTCGAVRAARPRRGGCSRRARGYWAAPALTSVSTYPQAAPSTAKTSAVRSIAATSASNVRRARRGSAAPRAVQRVGARQALLVQPVSRRPSVELARYDAVVAGQPGTPNQCARRSVDPAGGSTVRGPPSTSARSAAIPATDRTRSAPPARVARRGRSRSRTTIPSASTPASRWRSIGGAAHASGRLAVCRAPGRAHRACR